ncbi:MAG: pyridoxamine 5'-phosphate oxidase family protein [Cocleimonas sp.]|nr:pyridoxamine 5'-phosphate oxidase family protein [Cocleimonas sp.]
MGQQYTELNDKLEHFIEQQKIYFVATATANSKVNVSPKGMDSLRVLSKNRVIWLNLTGSGNETAAHIQETTRMTIMFAAFQGNPLILRLYGTAKVVHKNDADWDELYAHFDPLPGSRQIFDLTIDLVQSSCGMAVPFLDYIGERYQLEKWAVKKGDAGIRDYWQEKNQQSLDGKPTHIMDKNT